MPRLADSFEVKGLHLRNRLVMAPMVSGLSLGNAPTQAQIQWYRVRARGGVGLVVVEAAAIVPDGALLPFTLGIWDDAQVPALASLKGLIGGGAMTEGLGQLLATQHEHGVSGTLQAALGKQTIPCVTKGAVADGGITEREGTRRGRVTGEGTGTDVSSV